MNNNLVEKRKILETNRIIGEKFFYHLSQKEFVTAFKMYDFDLEYSNPIYGDLTLVDTLSMCSLILQNTNVFGIEYEFISSNERRVKIHWFLTLITSISDEEIELEINSFLKIDPNSQKIIQQIDIFSVDDLIEKIYQFKGKFLKYSPLFRKKFIEKCKTNLENYIIE